MTETEKIKLAMYEAVLLFLSENRNIVNTIRAFNWSIIKLRKIISEIRLKEKILSFESLERIIKTTKAKDQLFLSLKTVSTQLCDLALELDDPVLKQKCRLTQYSLINLLDFEFIEKANAILILAKRYLYKLKKFEISYSERKELKRNTEELRKDLENFKEAIHTKMTNYISGNTILTISLMFAECDKILCSYIDNYVEALAENFPYFYDEYLWMRNVENQNEIRTLIEIEDH